jgi:hypothetical protein
VRRRVSSVVMVFSHECDCAPCEALGCGTDTKLRWKPAIRSYQSKPKDTFAYVRACCEDHAERAYRFDQARRIPEAAR